LYLRGEKVDWRAFVTVDMDSLDYYKIEELLTDEERAIRDRARQFVQEEVLSEIVSSHRAAKFPDHLIPRMGALRFYAPYLHEPLAKLG
jgi:alkylation response protein AidB-like acyl-CoA dehydrogenase